MGQTDVSGHGSDEQKRAFTRAMLRDVEALEIMLAEGRIETGVRRVGAEQEVALIDQAGAPAPIGEKVLEELPAEGFTTELGRFNLEVNLDPKPFSGSSLRELETEILGSLDQVREVAGRHEAMVVLAGILPSLSKTDLAIENLTNRPRYHALNDALTRMRGGPYELNISGIDELSITHESIMVEACNTSFQVHFQVDPERFASWYNVAQLATAPVLAAAVNSPVLLGRRLWRESRIAVFQQSIDTRVSQSGMREFQPRVSFGTDWIRDSVLEIYQEDIARFKPLFHDVPDEDPLEELKQGRTPRLQALCLHNGTVYRWNRACYGITNGVPHLRIENRVLPSGPTPVDEVGNAAFWLGLVKGLHDTYGDVTKHIAFEDVHQNFLAAAREGLDSQLHWFDGQTEPAGELLLETIIPMARTGLESAQIDPADIDRYLGVVEQRVRKAQTGAGWILKAISGPEFDHHRGPMLARITAAMGERQLDNNPVHAWEPFDASAHFTDRRQVARIGQFMTTDLFTVHENDVVDLVTNLMEWKHIRHIPVEDDQHALVGMVSHRDLLHHLRRIGHGKAGDDQVPSVAVSEIMTTDPIFVSPETTTIEALRVLQEHSISCLPVVENGRLVGIVTEHDILQIAAPLLEDFLSD
ncbi:MAG: glutamate-cysteine ligase family protein [Phycisphaerales bacterium]|nr:glutamate-cysteine ligase family protein [Phycisphaerales bacterium]